MSSFEKSWELLGHVAEGADTDGTPFYFGIFQMPGKIK